MALISPGHFITPSFLKQRVETDIHALLVQSGAIVTRDIFEPEIETSGSISTSQDALSRAQDILHLDDVIIDGSLCVGFDCVNGGSFGFDTIRLKENNLRIKFQDTSSSASFPTNHWQITANDSANGVRPILALKMPLLAGGYLPWKPGHPLIHFIWTMGAG